MKRITCFGSLSALTFVLGSLVIGPFLLVSSLSAQNSQSSPALTQNVAPAQEQPLGDVARKIHKNADPSKAQPKVFDNDNLPMADKISVVGQPSDAANTVADSTAKPGDATASKPASEDDAAKKQAEWKSWQGKVERAKAADRSLQSRTRCSAARVSIAGGRDVRGCRQPSAQLGAMGQAGCRLQAANRRQTEIYRRRQAKTAGHAGTGPQSRSSFFDAGLSTIR